MRIIHHFFTALASIGAAAHCGAQEVSVPDPGLNAAIRETLQKPVGPLTQADLLSLTNLTARSRNVQSIVGLEAARHLVTLDLHDNHLTTFVLPNTLTNLTFLDVSLNAMRTCVLPSGLTNLASLSLGDNSLTNLTLPSDLAGLSSLNLDNNQISEFELSSNLTHLGFLDLGFNSLTGFSLPEGLTNLNTFYIAGNSLTNLTLPARLRRLTQLYLSQNLLTGFTLPAGLTNLLVLDLSFNQLTNLTLPGDLTGLGGLDLDFNHFTSLNLPSNLVHLSSLHLRSNQLTNFALPADMKALILFDIGKNQLTRLQLPQGLNQLVSIQASENQLTSLTLPTGLTNLTGIFLRFNQLTNLTFPPDLAHLVQIDVLGNQLAGLTLPSGLTSLITLVLSGNELTNLTLPPDVTQLSTLNLEGNPLATLVLAEALAATNLAEKVSSLRDQGVSVLTYPLTVQLVRPLALMGSFKFGITGPPGVYSVLGSTNFATWSLVGIASNPLGSVIFHDVTTNFPPQKFYRALPLVPPENMVFIPPNTFTLGTPTNEVNRQPDEGPQTIVTISHGFWIGKYEVTQRKYQAVIGSNPSQFPGDLDRPVETVSWLDATNYCARLTQQELVAGRIPPGSHYRLPTEAEWECAARAGTSTRFSYGDDPDFTGLTTNAWYAGNAGFVTHPVGQKAPNPWGLYDMVGNVLEWTLDWYGPYPGGSVTDPQGPASNAQGVKVIRGGAWDAFESDCRSGRRQVKGVHPLITDSILGFRVVLVTEPQ